MNSRLLIIAAAAILSLGACEDADTPSDYVARVGDRYLLREELAEALQSLVAAQDSADARQQIIEQWVTNELLHQEALRRGLRRDPDVVRLLEEGERSVLVGALVSRIYEEHPVSPSASEMHNYFEQHRDQFRLRETFVRVRYLAAARREDAQRVRDRLEMSSAENVDSLWMNLIEVHAHDQDLAAEISNGYYPESRIFLTKPALRGVVNNLLDRQIGPIVESDSLFHVVQLVERVPPQTVPKPEWVEDELVRRLVIQGRKQLYARQVQRLRNEALAREDLEVK